MYESLPHPHPDLMRLNSTNRTSFFSHNLFFIGLFVPLLLSIFSIVLTLLDSKEKIVGAGIHGLIGVFCFLISIYLLYGIITLRSNVKLASCNKTSEPGEYLLKYTYAPQNTTSGKEDAKIHENWKECAKKYIKDHGEKDWKHEILVEYCDNCLIKPNFKFELCVAAGVFGFFYALLNIGSAVLAFLAKRD